MLGFNSARFMRVTASVLVVLAAAHLMLRLLPLPGFPGDVILRAAVDLGAETSIGTWLSAVLWLLAATVAMLISRCLRAKGDGDSRWWLGFALIPLVISIDEVARLHERLSSGVRNTLDLGGALHFAWVIPVALVAVFLLALFARFFLRLPRWLAARIVLAGLISAGGAMGLELLGGAVDQAPELGRNSDAYLLTSTSEELLEFTGVLLLLAALLEQLRRLSPALTVELLAPGEPASAAKRRGFAPRPVIGEANGDD